MRGTAAGRLRCGLDDPGQRRGARRFVYKVKKPVDLGFLDFTTAERRATACADEARLRARLTARAADPTNVSDARPELWPALRAAFSEPAEVRDAVALDTTAPLTETVRRAMDAVRG